MVVDIEALNEIWRQVFSNEVKAWVIFKNGTCVVCRESDKDPSEYATDLMKNMGIVIPGSSHGDFVVHPLDKIPGWIVEYHHEDIFSYVSQSEFEGDDAGDMMVGLHGRHMRGEDAQSLEIIHIEIRDPGMNSG
ncbi:MAG: hypothetical protein RTU63_12940 [Candidatus Thorarchaeota archaeon]